MIDFDPNSFLQTIAQMYQHPVTPTASRGYDLAGRSLDNQLDMFNTTQKNQMAMFDRDAALRQMLQDWEMQTGNRQLSNAERQQQWSNNYQTKANPNTNPQLAVSLMVDNDWRDPNSILRQLASRIGGGSTSYFTPFSLPGSTTITNSFGRRVGFNGAQDSRNMGEIDPHLV